MTFEEVHSRLEKFIHYLAHTKANGAVLMDHDEISGELFLELWKGYQYYQDLEEEQLLAVLRRIFDNRIAELVHKYYNTHRGIGNNALSLQRMTNYEERPGNETLLFHDDWWYTTSEESNLVDPAVISESRDRVRMVYDRLSKEAQKVFSVIVNGNPMLGEHLTLSGIRASFVYQNGGTVKIKPWHIAKSLAMDEDTVKRIFSEIEEAYVEACNVQ